MEWHADGTLVNRLEFRDPLGDYVGRIMHFNHRTFDIIGPTSNSTGEFANTILSYLSHGYGKGGRFLRLNGK